jgi:hypothetical protein
MVSSKSAYSGQEHAQAIMKVLERKKGGKTQKGNSSERSLN